MINFLQEDKETLNEEIYQKGFELLNSRLTESVVRSDIPPNNPNKESDIVPPAKKPPINKDGSTGGQPLPQPQSPLVAPGQGSDSDNSLPSVTDLPARTTPQVPPTIGSDHQTKNPINNKGFDSIPPLPLKQRPELKQEPVPVPPTPFRTPKTDSNTHIQRPKRPRGKIAVVAAGSVASAAVAAGAVASAAVSTLAQYTASTISSAGSVITRPGGPGGIPPRGSYVSTINPKRWFIVGLLIFATALLAFTVVMAYAQPKSPIGQFAHGLVSRQQSPATITITPNSQQVQDNYTLTGATTTNPTTREIAVRTITGAAQSPATLAQATGHNQHPATSANGQITFFNSLQTIQKINAGQTLNVGGGIQIVTDQTAFVPAATPPNEGFVVVKAHTIPTGRAGNIGAYTFNSTACCAPNITVSNDAAFTGGQDATNYKFLQLSDVNNAISQSIKDATKQGAISDLNKQLQTGEQLLNAPLCTPTPQADQPIGDQGKNVTSANVSYRMNCTATAYDNLGAQNIIKDLLTQKANVTPGPGYVLVNNIQAILISQTTTKNTLSFFFTGKGIWAYLFSDAQKLRLEKAIAGKTVADAQTILKNTPGISNATINVNGGNTLPIDYNQISIVIQPIAGLGGGTPPPSTGSPTVTNPTIQSGTPGSNGKGGSAPPTGGSS
jgi:hypothetical protein